VEIRKNIKSLSIPLKDRQISELKVGDLVNINGILFTARDSAHQKLFQLIKDGKKLPMDIKGQILFYAGPTPSKPGSPIGSIGPTSSYRMDPFTPLLLEHGLKGMIGKGSRSMEVINSIVKNKAVYFAVIGGTAALVANNVKKCEEIYLNELKGETIYKLSVDNFTAVVAIDSYGNNIYDIEPPKYRNQ